MSSRLTKKTCIDCEKYLSSVKSKRCFQCFVKYNKKENCWQYKGGKPKCVDCGGKTKQYSSKRCRQCYLKTMIGETSPRYKGIIFNRVCLECTKNFTSKRKATFCSKECLSVNKRKPLAEKAWNWMSDRTKLSKQDRRNDSSYKEWRKQVWLRDNFTCKIANPDCKGRIEAHHILGWSEYPELRYQVNNGITLCHAHHPRRRAEEKRLIPTFIELVSVSSE